MKSQATCTQQRPGRITVPYNVAVSCNKMYEYIIKIRLIYMCCDCLWRYHLVTESTITHLTTRVSWYQKKTFTHTLPLWLLYNVFNSFLHFLWSILSALQSCWQEEMCVLLILSYCLFRYHFPLCTGVLLLSHSLGCICAVNFSMSSSFHCI